MSGKARASYRGGVKTENKLAENVLSLSTFPFVTKLIAVLSERGDTTTQLKSAIVASGFWGVCDRVPRGGGTSALMSLSEGRSLKPLQQESLVNYPYFGLAE